MDTKKFKKVIETDAEKISSSLRPLAELLLQWYERELAEDEVKKYDQSN